MSPLSIASILTICGLFVFAPVPANAATVLEVDISDPAAVMVSSTTAPAMINASSPENNGVTLIDLFPENSATVDAAVTSGAINLLGVNEQDGARGADLAGHFVDFFAGGWTPDDLSIYYFPFNSVGVNYARTDTRAIAGTVVIDLTGFALPSPGTTGNVVIDSPDDGKVIGQFLVVPEPAIPELASLAALLCLGSLKRPRRRSSAS
jgi:hypothetical protein